MRKYVDSKFDSSNISSRENITAMYNTYVGGRSANNFRQSQIRKFADSNNLLDLPTFRKCDSLRICDLRTNLFMICGLETSANTHFFSLKIKHIILLHKFVRHKNRFKR